MEKRNAKYLICKKHLTKTVLGEKFEHVGRVKL